MRTLFLFFPVAVFLTGGCLGYLSTDDSHSSSELNNLLLPYSEYVTEDYLYEHLSVIAHDSLKGRETAMPGQKIAADYLAGFYSDLGLTPAGDDGTFYQSFDLIAEQKDSLVFRTYRTGTDTLLVNHSVASSDTQADYIQIFGGSRALKGEIVFAGFGINDQQNGVNHLEGADLEDKWVLVFEDIPHVVDGDTLVNPDINNNQRFSDIASRNNAKGLLVIGRETPDQFDSLTELNSRLISRPRNFVLKYMDSNATRRAYPKGYLQISPELATEILEFDNFTELEKLRRELTDSLSEFSAYQLPFLLDYRPYNRNTEVESHNIAAFLEGSDPDLRDEVIILTAHYDHIGISHPDQTGDFINNGADDNGSGTVALMSIANVLQKAAGDGLKPRRSILFLHVSAEESGLLGSRYYSDHPIFPLEDTVASYNADMIGRSTTEREESGDTDYIFIIGGDIISSELDSLVHVANRTSVNMELDYSYNDLNDPNQFYRRSDHWNLGRLEVPFVFFFTGTHEDYHRPGDSVNKVDFPKLVRTTRLIYASTLQVANYDNRPEVDNQQFINITRSSPR
ncbi:MAG: M28 family peptidase [Balneolaceae bacterium]